MRVLIGCEFSGIVREAFRARGHAAWSCDLAPAEDDSQFHLQTDLLSVVRQFSGKPWDLIIAHPPCRYISVSGMHWTTRGLRDPAETDKAIAFAEAIWDAPCSKVCIENPTSVLSTRSKLGRAKQLVQPYQYGHDASKGTRLWLRGLSPLYPLPRTEWIAPRRVCKCGAVYRSKLHCPGCGASQSFSKPRWANQTDGGQNKLAPSAHRSADRARTYAGIARAMAEQWG